MYYSPNVSLSFSLKKLKEYCVIFLSLRNCTNLGDKCTFTATKNIESCLITENSTHHSSFKSLFWSNTVSWTNLFRCYLIMQFTSAKVKKSYCCIYFEIPIDAFNCCPPIFFYTQGARLSIRGSRRLPPLILFLFMIYFELSGREIRSFVGC